jgi:hypothetical protein
VLLVSDHNELSVILSISVVLNIFLFCFQNLWSNFSIKGKNHFLEEKFQEKWMFFTQNSPILLFNEVAFNFSNGFIDKLRSQIKTYFKTANNLSA